MKKELTNARKRPEIRAPLFEMAVYEPEEVTPGYWFIAPYARIVQEKHPLNYYQACQTGPSIYDSNGVGKYEARPLACGS